MYATCVFQEDEENNYKLLGKSVSCLLLEYLTTTNENFIKFIKIKVNICTKREMFAHNWVNALSRNKFRKNNPEHCKHFMFLDWKINECQFSRVFCSIFYIYFSIFSVMNSNFYEIHGKFTASSLFIIYQTVFTLHIQR